MTVGQASDLVRETLLIMLVISAPILLSALVIGLLISIVQAATQIQEQTLTFVPKMVVMVIAAILITPWVGKMMIEFAQRMFSGDA